MPSIYTVRRILPRNLTELPTRSAIYEVYDSNGAHIRTKIIKHCEKIGENGKLQKCVEIITIVDKKIKAIAQFFKGFSRIVKDGKMYENGRIVIP